MAKTHQPIMDTINISTTMVKIFSEVFFAMAIPMHGSSIGSPANTNNAKRLGLPSEGVSGESSPIISSSREITAISKIKIALIDSRIIFINGV